MANYDSAILKVLKNEGGYVNDPADKGGETYKGISRKNWGSWGGWINIDGAKKRSNFPKSLYSNVLLNNLVIEFYKKHFWQPVGCDDIKDQDIADMLVDSAVLEGIRPAVKRAQKICGLTQTGVVSEELKTKLNSLV